MDADKFSIFKSKQINSISDETITNYDKLFDENYDLSDNDKSKLKNIVDQYTEHFIVGIPSRRVTTGELEIRLLDANKTVQRRPYRLGVDEKELVRDKIKEMLAANVIRPSNSPFASPILLVKKKDGSDRLCIDYRELNANTVADKYPLPLISDQVNRLRGGKYFSCLDMASGFYQIPIDVGSIERTAFVTPEGQYEFLSMPFGLKNASSIFQRAIARALGDLAYSYAIVYIDDVVIVARSKRGSI